MAANEVIDYHSDETGAPVLNNAAGSLIAVLDACLITGFRPVTLTGLSVTGGVAMATFAGHGYVADRVVEVAGAAVGALNGRKRTLSVTGDTFTFDATGVADTASVGGTVTVKRPGLGWVKAFAGTNTAIYARTQVGARAQMLRIDDTSTANPPAPRARMVEAATGVDSYTNPSPLDSQLNGGAYWIKGDNSATPKKWRLRGDGLSFYLSAECGSFSFASYKGLGLTGFGDLISFRPGDPYGSFLAGSTSSGYGFELPATALSGPGSQSSSVWIARQYHGLLPTPTWAAVLVPGLNGGARVGANGPPFPSAVNNGLEIEYPVRVVDNAGFIRGLLPGLAAPLADVAGQLHGQLLTNIEGAGGRAFRGVSCISSSQGPSTWLFDETGPWQ